MTDSILYRENVLCYVFNKFLMCAFFLLFNSYGRVYTADAYHAALAPAAYGVGAMVSVYIF